MKSLYDLSFTQLQELCIANGWKKFHGQQIFEWLYRQRVESIDQMSNIAKHTRDRLNEEYTIAPLTLKEKQVAKDGTTKYLFQLQDGYYIETVLMLYEYGRSVCVTTQVGCNMGCTFCASGLLKKKRDLTAGEMVAQIMAVQRDLDESKERVSHIVVMGTGEPFDNYDNVLNFLSIVNHDRGFAIGARHLTISTCGLVPKIREFAEGKYQYNLAISLHAPNNELRSKIMPINTAYPLEELMDSLRYYCKLNNRRLTFEYILLKGVNDKDIHVEQLAKILQGINAYVNLIPYNEVDEHGFKTLDRKNAMIFYDKLMKKNVRCTIRKEHGGDIDAACGQLRAKHEK